MQSSRCLYSRSIPASHSFNLLFSVSNNLIVFHFSFICTAFLFFSLIPLTVSGRNFRVHGNFLWLHLSAFLSSTSTLSLVFSWLTLSLLSSYFLADSISVSWRVAVFLRHTVWMTMGSITPNLVMYVPAPLGGLAANRWDFIRFHQPWRHNSPKVTLCLIFLFYVNSMSVPVCNGGFTMRWIVKG